MKAWLNQHAQALQLVLSRFKNNKLNTTLISLAISVSIALPSVAYVLIDNLRALSSQVRTDSQLSVFLKAEIDDAFVQNIKANLVANNGIKAVQFISKAQALKALLADSNADLAFTALDKNPLPDAFLIEPKQFDNESIEQLKQQISQINGVDEVVVDGAWIKRLNYLLALGNKIMLILASLLAFALVAVIGNTIRMQILTQRDEIELSQLIGATNRFIRRPFLYAGALYGLFGGLLGLILCALVIYLFNQSIVPLAAEYAANFNLHQPTFALSLLICITSVLLGVLSAYLAVSKSLLKSIV